MHAHQRSLAKSHLTLPLHNFDLWKTNRYPVVFLYMLKLGDSCVFLITKEPFALTYPSVTKVKTFKNILISLLNL